LGHIIFHNWLAVVLTFIGGILFTKRYIDTKSLVASIIEHSLYGVWLFTCGLGMFFTEQAV
jgi:membrane protease YdiL (CAAX protease family)